MAGTSKCRERPNPYIWAPGTAGCAVIPLRRLGSGAASMRKLLAPQRRLFSPSEDLSKGALVNKCNVLASDDIYVDVGTVRLLKGRRQLLRRR